MADQYLHNRIDEILRQRIMMGAGEFSEEMDFVGGLAKGSKMSKAQYKKIWKSKNGNLRGMEAAWKKLLAKRRKKPAKKPKAKPRPKRQLARNKNSWISFLKANGGRGYTMDQLRAMYRQ